eukprot:1138291-Pelagomonas_calceolata.AAC.1
MELHMNVAWHLFMLQLSCPRRQVQLCNPLPLSMSAAGHLQYPCKSFPFPGERTLYCFWPISYWHDASLSIINEGALSTHKLRPCLPRKSSGVGKESLGSVHVNFLQLRRNMDQKPPESKNAKKERRRAKKATQSTSTCLLPRCQFPYRAGRERAK